MQPHILNSLTAKSIAAWLCIGVCILAQGCAGNEKINRRSVQDLYLDAMKQAATRPPIVQPTPQFSEASHAQFQHDVPATLYEPGCVHSASTIPCAQCQSQPSRVQLATAQETNSKLLPIPVTDQSYVALASNVVNVRRINDGISEIFEQTEIREALQILATAANETIIVDDTVSGDTSAQIENETFEQALDKLLMPLGYVYAKHEGKYIIAPADPDSPLFPYISDRYQYLPCNHTAVILANMLPPRYKRFYQISPERDLIIIEAPEVIGKDILARLREIDRPVPQIELEAIVCVSAPDKDFRFGLDWGHVVGVQGVDSLKAGMTGLTFQGSASKAGMRDAFSDFAVTSAFVRLLAQEGYVTIRAAPRVTTKDGEKASISINRETFFSLQPSTSNVLFRQDVQKVEAGISLEITPRVHGDMVSVRISKAEVSEDIRAQSSGSDASTSAYPIINRRVVSTDVNVRDGHTVVIGGLVQRQTVDRINRVPGLHRIPLVGKLFQTIEKQERDAEVAIFISPRIVPAEQVVLNQESMTTEEVDSAQLNHKSTQIR